MVFVFHVWKLTITINLFDLDPSDGSLAFSVVVSWK